MISTAFLSGGTKTVDLSTLNTSQAVTFAGAASGDRAGSSVADGGDVNGATGSVDDLLIGAPAASSLAGAAYLVYGGSNSRGHANNRQQRTLYQSVELIRRNRDWHTIPGATFVGDPGAVTGSHTGFAVSAGGDFNADGDADILIGAPGWSSSSTTVSQGLSTCCMGRPVRRPLT